MFCPQCGSPLTEGARFCSSCGSPLSVPASPVAEEPEEWRESPEEAAPDPEESEDFIFDDEPAAPESSAEEPLTERPETPAEESAYFTPAPYVEPAPPADSPYFRPAAREKQASRGKSGGALFGILAGVVILLLLLLVLAVRGVIKDIREDLPPAKERSSQQEDSGKSGKTAGEDSSSKSGKAAQEDEDGSDSASGKGGKTAGAEESSSGKSGKSEGGSHDFQTLVDELGREPLSPLAGGSGDYLVYGGADEDGWYYFYEFLCDGDEVTHMADILYIPMEEGEWFGEFMMESLEESFSIVSDLDFCQVQLDYDEEYFIVVVVQENMDDPDHVEQLLETEYLSGTGSTISMEEMEQSLLAEGMVRK